MRLRSKVYSLSVSIYRHDFGQASSSRSPLSPLLSLMPLTWQAQHGRCPTMERLCCAISCHYYFSSDNTGAGCSDPWRSKKYAMSIPMWCLEEDSSIWCRRDQFCPNQFGKQSHKAFSWSIAPPAHLSSLLSLCSKGNLNHLFLLGIVSKQEKDPTEVTIQAPCVDFKQVQSLLPRTVKTLKVYAETVDFLDVQVLNHVENLAFHTNQVKGNVALNYQTRSVFDVLGYRNILKGMYTRPHVCCHRPTIDAAPVCFLHYY